jgi:hypothetical protein
MICRSAVPGILSDAELLEHQALLGSGYAHLVQVEALVYSGLHLVVLSTDVQVELDLLGPYNRTYNTVNPAKTAGLLREATVALEQHIESRSGQTFNDYLYVRGLKVGRDFASLSAIVAETINPLNIA